MNRLASLFAVSALGALWMFAPLQGTKADGVAYKVGNTISDFALKDEHGKTVKLSQFPGKVIVMTFYASW